MVTSPEMSLASSSPGGFEDVGALKNERERSRLADQALKRQELRQPWGPRRQGPYQLPRHFPVVGIRVLLQVKDLLGLMDLVSLAPGGCGGVWLVPHKTVWWGAEIRSRREM